MQHDENIQKLAQLIEDIRIVMLTTIDPDGRLRSRPMATQQLTFNGDLWFFTSKSSGKIHSIVSDQEVNLAYSKPEDGKFVSVTGTAEVIDDRKKAEELWNPAYRAWFPEGLEDPDLILIRVRVESAEYWESSSANMKIIEFAKSILGKRPSEKPSSGHNRIKIAH